MKNHTVILVTMLFTFNLLAQNPNLDFKYSIKGYNNTSFDVDENNVEILRPSLAFQKQTKKHNFHEVELISLSMVKGVGDPGYHFVSSKISARYEYIFIFNKSKDSKFVPSLGLGANPYYSLNESSYSGKISYEYLSSHRYLGVKTFVTPRLTYYTTSKVFFDVNIPFCLFDANVYTYKHESSYSIKPASHTTTLNISEFPMIYNLRIGVGLKI